MTRARDTTRVSFRVSSMRFRMQSEYHWESRGRFRTRRVDDIARTARRTKIVSSGCRSEGEGMKGGAPVRRRPCGRFLIQLVN